MNLSIVIPTHNRHESLRRCLGALMREVPGAAGVEVLVVDDGSADDVDKSNAVLCAGLKVDYRHLDSARGAAAARSTGVRHTRGLWVAFLDDDVTVLQGWYAHLQAALDRHVTDDVVGIEGATVPSGEGLWDREVSNATGGLFLTSHIVYRRSLLDTIGGFDEAFGNEGPPAGEDHELAARALMRGRIVFEPSLTVTHLPRSIRAWAYVADSPRRMRGLLRAELYFYVKQRDRYHAFRHARSFWGTYRDILLKHTLITLRRRTPADLARHPLQAASLLAGTFCEQCVAWLLLPRMLALYVNCHPNEFERCVDWGRTLRRWRIDSKDPAGLLRLKRDYVRAAVFPLARKPVYDARAVLASLGRAATTPIREIYLRIDDVFLNERECVETLCERLAARKAPFLAAVTGDDLRASGSGPLLDIIARSGGELALHGFRHEGRYGPYQSEILQLSLPELDARITEVIDKAEWRRVRVFVPPFNAVNGEQIRHLARRFDVVCGGPETARFTERLMGPVAVTGGGWYIPSFHPFYGCAAGLLRTPALRSARGLICITVHMAQEARDGFAALMRLVDACGRDLEEWTRWSSGERQ